MSAFRIISLIFGVLGSVSLFAQQSPPDALSLIQQSLAAQGHSAISDVTIIGSVTITARGSKPTQGTITLVATASGQSTSVCKLPLGEQKTVYDYSSTSRFGKLTGPDGVAYNVSSDELMGPHPAWFYPAFVMNSVSLTKFTVSYMGQETRAGATVEHIAVWPTGAPVLRANIVGFGHSTIQPAQTVYLGQEDFYLDSSSFLPVALSFQRPRYSQSQDKRQQHAGYVTQEVRFSNYQVVQGQLAPLHLQVLSSTAPVYEIDVTSITFNTGVIISEN